MTTPRLGLSELIANQSQPHIPVNTAHRRLDALVQAVVLDKDLLEPPATNQDGDCFLIAAGGGVALGEWAGLENYLAYFWQGWSYVAPFNGAKVYVADEGEDYRYQDVDSPAGWGILTSGGGGGPSSPDAPVTPIYSEVANATAGASEDDFDGGDWNGGLDKNCLVIECDPGGSTFSGLDSTSVPNGKTILLSIDDAGGDGTFNHEDGGSAAGNQFSNVGATDVTMPAGSCRQIVKLSGKWRFL